MAKTNTADAFRILDLPREIRQSIYGLVLAETEYTWTSSVQTFCSAEPLLSVCQSMRTDALNVLPFYGTFCLSFPAMLNTFIADFKTRKERDNHNVMPHHIRLEFFQSFKHKVRLTASSMNEEFQETEAWSGALARFPVEGIRSLAFLVHFSSVYMPVYYPLGHQVKNLLIMRTLRMWMSNKRLEFFVVEDETNEHWGEQGLYGLNTVAAAFDNLRSRSQKYKPRED